jgi:hypothetical protein
MDRDRGTHLSVLWIHLHPDAGSPHAPRNTALASSRALARLRMRIPTQSGRVFRFDAGRDSDLKPATTFGSYFQA